MEDEGCRKFSKHELDEERRGYCRGETWSKEYVKVRLIGRGEGGAVDASVAQRFQKGLLCEPRGKQRNDGRSEICASSSPPEFVESKGLMCNVEVVGGFENVLDGLWRVNSFRK